MDLYNNITRSNSNGSLIVTVVKSITNSQQKLGGVGVSVVKSITNNLQKLGGVAGGGVGGGRGWGFIATSWRRYVTNLIYVSIYKLCKHTGTCETSTSISSVPLRKQLQNTERKYCFVNPRYFR